MSVPLLGTKLFVPRPRPNLVARDRLATLVDRGLSGRLLLVSAPAGFGKTTLVVERLTAAAAAPTGPAVAWLALDAGDDDPSTFWTYVVSALRTALPGVGADALTLLADPVPAFDSVLTTLLNDLVAADRDVVLVLDDYHVVSSLVVHTQMAFLLDHLPARSHLVLVTRADPVLPLGRLRASGEMVEVRAADLRFDEHETAAYFSGAVGLELSEDQVAAIGGRAEGWVAALQLAALSMSGREDPAAFVDALTGEDRYLVDYLVEEVLQRQSPEVHDFLLRTSVLDRMSGSLCDAVVGADGGRATLEALDRANLFLVPLDDRRQWYRYHHLFADVLRVRLGDEHPGLPTLLHQRASAWFEQHDDRAEAIRHALAAGDVERVAGLVELEMPVMRRERREPLLRRWLESLPEGVLRTRPVLANGLAGVRLSTGAVAGVAEWIEAAEACLDPSRPGTVRDGAVVVDREELPRLPAWLAVHRAGLALVTGDLAGVERFAASAEELATDDDHLNPGAASALVGLAAWSQGDLARAEECYAASLPHFEAVGHVADVLGCSQGLADIRSARGRPRSAVRTLRSALALLDGKAGDVVRGTTDIHVGLAALHVELGDTAAARDELLLARQLGDRAGLPQSPYRWRAAMAHVLEAEGDVDGALAMLAESATLYNGDFSPDTRPVLARRARLALRHGRWPEVTAWLETTDLSLTTEPSYLREYELVTLARAVATGPTAGRERGDEALALLRELRSEAEAASRAGSLLDICTAEALVLEARGDRSAALEPLAVALELAEPDGFVRHFVDEGPAMAALLEAVPRDSAVAAYAGALRAAWTGAVPEPARGPDAPPPQALVDPLSARELEILRLLATELTGPEIARRLVVSLNTVRTHTKNVYLKLGVNSRMAALRRGRELGLL